MQQVLVLHGPNLNLLGTREPEIYGSMTLGQLNDTLITQGLNSGVQVECRQSNAENELIDSVQQAATNKVQFLILNAGGYTHTSIALRDSLLATQVPFIEVHISNTYNREDFRARSYLSDIAQGVIVGLGPLGYELALNAAIKYLNK
ncbi:MAG TPA: type II 3-dehydroquinate dehydratase [Gammaproteobacteria bacterium]|nr:type II 3-dehydroquinate dehydratase [Gammaproteobacteria bacterium]